MGGVQEVPPCVMNMRVAFESSIRLVEVRLPLKILIEALHVNPFRISFSVQIVDPRIARS